MQGEALLNQILRSTTQDGAVYMRARLSANLSRCLCCRLYQQLGLERRDAKNSNYLSTQALLENCLQPLEFKAALYSRPFHSFIVNEYCLKSNARVRCEACYKALHYKSAEQWLSVKQKCASCRWLQVVKIWASAFMSMMVE